MHAASVSLALVVGDVLAAGPVSAAEYPSWEDVLAARSSESAKQGEITRIQGLIAGLETESVAAQALAYQRGAEYETAQIAFDRGVLESELATSRAGDATTLAEASSKKAGALAVQLARTGGNNLSISLFTGGDDADALLYQLGALSQLTATTSDIYDAAEQSRNAAESLSAQAVVAQDALAGLRLSAEAALTEATLAQQAVDASLAEQQGRRVELATQLDVLVTNRQATEVDYQAGVAERRRIAEEAARVEREARAAAERERANAGNGSGGGAPSGGSGPVMIGPGGQGWTTPLPNARVTSEYGNRLHPIDKVWRLHAGIDLVSPGGTCGANVYAASSGTVTFAGSNGGLGNAVTINHGGGRTTVYGHNTSLVVRSGWSVVEGQLIAKAGTTGASTGCHVHFETRLNGTAQNPRDVLAPYGVAF